MDELRKKEDEKEEANATKMTAELAAGHINPLNFLARLDKVRGCGQYAVCMTRS